MWFDDGGAFLVDYDGPVEAYRDDYTELIHSIETMNMMRSIQPDVLINDRLGRGTTDFMTPEQFVPEPGSYSSAHNFESCLTINSSWGYNKTDVNWKSPKEIVYELVMNASMGGNYLLNVGPTSEGEIDPVDAAILRGAGKWIHRNAEAIYGTQASPIPQPEWGRITSRRLQNGDTRLYLHVFMGSEDAMDEKWDGELVVPHLRNRPLRAYALTPIPRRSYDVSQRANAVVIRTTGRVPDVVNTVIVLDVAGAIVPREES
jgi:alpha-L-fucosidase